MKNLKTLHIAFLLLLMNSIFSQSPYGLTVVLDKTIGTVAQETSRMIRQVPGQVGGFVIAGKSNAQGAGNSDISLIRTDEFGNKIWEKVYGFAEQDRIQWAMDNGLQLTFNQNGIHDGYIMVGTTVSYPGHGNGLKDVYVVRTDKLGNELWHHVIGGAGEDFGRSIIQDSNGDFIICGQTPSFGASGTNILVIKIMSDGQFEKDDGDENTGWLGMYNLSDGAEHAYNLIEVPGGYLLTGDTYGANTGVYLYKIKYNGDHYPNYGNIAVLPGIGTYDRTGGNYHLIQQVGIGYQIEKVTGGYMVVGGLNNNSFMRKLDGDGEPLSSFDHVIVGPGANFAYVVEEYGPGYLVAGETNGIGAGNWDFWVFIIDQNGTVIWEEVYGGVGREWCTSMEPVLNSPTQAECFMLTGLQDSFGEGSTDFWLLQLCNIPDPAFIEGTVYLDDNPADCNYDPVDEIPLANQLIYLSPGPFLTRTNEQGEYSFRVTEGTYDATFASTPIFQKVPCQPNPITNIAVLPGDISSGNDFALEDNSGGGTCNGEVKVVSVPFGTGTCPAPLTLSSPCPGFLHKYKITLNNNSGKKSNTIKLHNPETYLVVILPEGMSYNSMSPSECSKGNGTIGEPETIAPNPNNPVIPENATREILVWGEVAFEVGGITYSNNVFGGVIGITQHCDFDLFVDVGSSAEQPFVLNAEFNARCNNNQNGISTSSLTQQETAYCSCDPNDKQASPRGCGKNGNIEPNQDITYRIRFENIGTGPAHDIYVRDVIDSNLDILSFELVGSTHEVTSIQIEPGNELVVYFDGIELPASGKGEFYLRFNQLPNLPDGTAITNEASIYFDFNPPVITNTVLNTIRSVPSPEAAFESMRACNLNQNELDFSYTGSTPDGASYFWDFGPNASPSTSIQQNPSGIIFDNLGSHPVSLTVYRYGCDISHTENINVDDISCGYPYVLLAGEEIEVDECIVNSGGVGVWDNNGKIKIEDGTQIIECTTFVEADEVDVDNSSQVTNILEQPANPVLPIFLYNNNPSNLEIEVNAGTTVVLTGNIYEDIEVDENATIIFSGHENVFIEDLKTKENVTILFDQCTNLILDGKVTLGEENHFNTGQKQVQVFAEKKINFKKENQIWGTFYTEKDLKVRKSDASNPSVLHGLFIAEEELKVDENTEIYCWGNSTVCNVSALMAPASEENMEVNLTPSTRGFQDEKKATISKVKDFTIYPNPATQTLHVNLQNYLGQNVFIAIYNQFGQRVLFLQKQELEERHLSINLLKEQLPNGIYLCSIRTSEGQVAKQFVITR